MATMIFGERVIAPATTDAAAWIAGACRGTWWTVGALVPNGYDRFVRVRAPDPIVDDWWAAYRGLYEVVASIGVRHTSSPERAWFAVWEGHGFGNVTTRLAWDGPIDDDTRRWLDEERARLLVEDRRRNEAVRTARRDVPTFELPNRAYHLLGGDVMASTRLRHPGSPSEWRNPDLFWPDDRRWFVATDVDFWSLYVGGDDDFVSELVAAAPTPTEIVTLDRQLEVED